MDGLLCTCSGLGPYSDEGLCHLTPTWLFPTWISMAGYTRHPKIFSRPDRSQWAVENFGQRSSYSYTASVNHVGAIACWGRSESAKVALPFCGTGNASDWPRAGAWTGIKTCAFRSTARFLLLSLQVALIVIKAGHLTFSHLSHLFDFCLGTHL